MKIKSKFYIWGTVESELILCSKADILIMFREVG